MNIPLTLSVAYRRAGVGVAVIATLCLAPVLAEGIDNTKVRTAETAVGDLVADALL